MVWAADGTTGRQTIHVEVLDLDGRLVTAFPPFVQSSNDAAPAPVDPRDVALDAERMYVAAGKAGLLVFARTEPKLLGSPEGVPRSALISVAAVGGKLIMGFDPDYLCAFDPASSCIEEIAYSRSLLKRNPLDGCQDRFAVRSLAADPARACVWMTTDQPHAFWRITLADYQIDKHGDPAPIDRHGGRNRCGHRSS